METSEDFIDIFNEFYPFERYIFKNPQPINYLFDDAILTEIFVPYTEIKPITNEKGNYICSTLVPDDEVYVKIKGLSSEMRFSFFDFADHIREQIVNNFIEDFGAYNYESLYVDHENKELKTVLNNEKLLITQKYGKCNIKNTFRSNLVEK